MQLKYYSLIFSVAGIALLYFLSTLTQPIAIGLYKIPNHEGDQVIVEGLVTEHYITNYGSQLITIQDNNSTALLFIEGTIDLEFGDKIKGVGRVQKYEDGWEIIVNDVDYISIIKKWSNITFPIWQLVENPSKYVSLNINISGYVDLVFDNYFYLIDSEDQYSLMVIFNPSNNERIFSGEKVQVAGEFIFDEKDLRYKLMINDEKHGIFHFSEE